MSRALVVAIHGYCARQIRSDVQAAVESSEEGKMPNRQVHNFVNKILLGESYSKVSKLIDYPIKILPGPKHRVLFHDVISAPIVGTVVSRNIKGTVAALSHITVDACCTKNKALKNFLTFLSKNSEGKKPRRNQQKI